MNDPRRFWNNIDVPLPEPLPKIRKKVVDNGFTTYFSDTHEIWFLSTDWNNRFAMLHETGHAFAYLHMTKDHRTTAARIMGHPGLRWYWGSWNPLRHIKQPNEENFADWYAECAMGASGKQHQKLRKLLYSIKSES